MHHRGTGVGGALQQQINGASWQPLAFFSQKLTPTALHARLVVSCLPSTSLFDTSARSWKAARSSLQPTTELWSLLRRATLFGVHRVKFSTSSHLCLGVEHQWLTAYSQYRRPEASALWTPSMTRPSLLSLLRSWRVMTFLLSLPLALLDTHSHFAYSFLCVHAFSLLLHALPLKHPVFTYF